MVLLRNTNGKNKGKKYIKLKGDEVITEDAICHAKEFSGWFSENFVDMKQQFIYPILFDEDVFQETYIHLYDCITKRNLHIQDFKWYFIRTYHMKIIALKKANKHSFVNIENCDNKDGFSLCSPNADSVVYNECVGQLVEDIIIYVRDNYAEYDASVFERYIRAKPEISIKKLALDIGCSIGKTWVLVSKIKKEVQHAFKEKHEKLLLF